jgi:serine/threonine protein kinase
LWRLVFIFFFFVFNLGRGLTPDLTQIKYGHPDVFWEDVSRAYHAPELVNDPTLRGEHVDVFSLGAIAYHIFSGQPPAGSSLELAEKLRRDRGLKLSSVLDGAGEELQMLVEHSTHPEVTVRLASVDEFLEQLAHVEEEFTSPTQEVVANPADAKQGDQLHGHFLVKHRFGSGSAAIVFLVEKDGRELVLKLANQPENNARILDEFESLKKVRHPNVVQAYDKVMVGALQGFTMQRAGELTLAQRLSKEGRLSLELLERFGEQLLEAINYLDQEGISHRDVKPENLGIGSLSGGGKLRLVLFDFSLARTPADNIRAGTPPYLEPFLSLRRPQRWDTHAERYAVAMTLYQMATGQRPIWGDGVSDPAQLDCEATLDAEKFDTVIRESLLAFFRQALKRDYRQRFDNAEEMLRAWRKIFEGLDQPSAIAVVAPGTDAPTGLAVAVPESKIAILGLTARAVAAIDRLGATTELVIRALRAEAQAARADWNVVLRADASPQPSEDWKRLLLLVNRTMPKVEAELDTSPKTLLLVNPGLLARYQQLEILVRLRDRIGRTGSPLFGLWILVPTNGLAVLPTLDGQPVPVLSAAQWTHLTGAWIQNKHRA